MVESSGKHHWTFLRSWGRMHEVMAIVAGKVDCEKVTHNEIVTKQGDHYHFGVIQINLSGLSQLEVIQLANSIDISDVVSKSDGVIKRMEETIKRKLE